MTDCDKDIRAYHDERVRLTEDQKNTLRDRRDANRDRLRRGLKKNGDPAPVKSVIQGSYAMGTVIQEPESAYDIDDGVVFTAKSLLGPKGASKTALDARKMVRNAVDDGSFKTDPEIKTNCVRVYYDDGPHVDIPVYRSTNDWNGDDKCELASVDWKDSDPEGVNRWFREWVKAKRAGGMEHSRELIRLLKSICKNRPSYTTLPSGFVLTVLVQECYQSSDGCLDIELRELIEAIHRRLEDNLTVAHPVVSGEWLIDDDTKHRTEKLRELLGMAVKELAALDRPNCTLSETLKAWKKVFCTEKTVACTDFFDQRIEDAVAEEKRRTSAGVTAPAVVSAPKSYCYRADATS